MVKLFGQLKPDAPYGFDVLTVRDSFQLFADIADVDVDCLILADVQIVPCVVVDILLGKDLIGVGEQQL